LTVSGFKHPASSKPRNVRANDKEQKHNFLYLSENISVMKSYTNLNLKTKEELIRDLVHLQTENNALKNRNKERIKELQAIYKINSLMVKPNLSLDKILQKIVEIIPSSWQYPEYTCARIILGEKEVHTSNFKITNWKQTEFVPVKNIAKAIIEVYYLEPKPNADEGPFLTEERNLLKLIANDLSKIIETKNLVNQLVESEEKFSTSFQKSPIAKCLVDKSDDFKFLDVNEKFLRLTGFSRDDLENRFLKDINFFSKEVINSILVPKVKHKGKVKNFELTFQNKLGEFKTGLLNIEIIQLKNRDLALVVVHDITQRKEVEKQLQERDEFNSKLLNTIPYGMNIIDKNGKILFANEHQKKQFGSDIIGKKCWEKFRSDNIQCAYCPLKKPLKKGEIQICEFEGSKGKQIFEINHTNLIFEGKEAILEIFHDITKRKTAENKIQQNERRLKGIFENLQDAFFQADLSGNFSYMNPMVLQMYGYHSEEELLGKPATLLYANSAEREKLIEKLKQTGKITDYTAQALKKDGTVFWVSMNVQFIYDNDGNIIGTQGIVRDITERKNAELEILKAKERAEKGEKQLQALFDNVSDGIGISINGLCYMVNNAYIEMFGYSNAQEIIGTPLVNQIAPKEHSRIKYYIQNRNIDDSLPKQYETIGIKKNGDEFPLEIIVGTYQINNQTFSFGILRDITQRKKQSKELITAKEKAEQSDYRLQLAVDSGKLGIWDFNVADGKLIWNKRMYELYGIDENKFSGDSVSWENGIHPDDKKKAKEDLALALSGEKELNISFRVVHPDNTVLYLKANAIVIRDEFNNPIRMIGINRDITTLVKRENELVKAKEKAEESDKLKSAFLLNISHEIRTPMNGILGFMNLLNQPGLDEKDRSEFISIVNKSGERLMNTINDIVEVSKIEIGDLNLNYEDVNLFELMSYYYNFFKIQTAEKGLDFEISKQISGSSALVTTDKHKLDGILMNLIKNAIKFTKNGKIEIGNYLKNGYVWFYVSDTGIGIPEDKVEAIFNRFVSVDNTLTRGYEGLGIGLSIVKAYVVALNGSIKVESEIGKGSTFLFSIPYKSVEAEIDKPNINLTVTIPNRKPIVLIAEDDEVNFYLLEKLLANEYKILHAVNGIEAVNIFTDNPEISLILMDIKMPGEYNGLEATRKIRELNQQVPIIAQTAYAMEADRLRAITVGCNDVITKPFNADKLLTLIQKYFNKKS